MNSSWLIQVALAAQAASRSEAWVGVAVLTSLGVRVPGSRDVAPIFPLPVRIDRGRSGQRESGMRLARIARVVSAWSDKAFAVPISARISNDRTAALRGDAMLAGWQSGVFPDFSVATEHSHYVGLLKTDDRNLYIYRASFTLYPNVCSPVQDDFKSLQSLPRRTSS